MFMVYVYVTYVLCMGLKCGPVLSGRGNGRHQPYQKRKKYCECKEKNSILPPHCHRLFLLRLLQCRALGSQAAVLLVKLPVGALVVEAVASEPRVFEAGHI